MSTHVTVIEKSLGRTLLPHLRHVRASASDGLWSPQFWRKQSRERATCQPNDGVYGTDKTGPDSRAYSLMQNVRPAPSEYSESFWKPMWR